MLEALEDKAAVLLRRRNGALAWTPLGYALLAPHVPFGSTEDPGARP